MVKSIGVILVFIAAAGFVYVTVVFARNLRYANVDSMGLSIGFDRIWIGAAFLLAVGTVLWWELRWTWGVGVFVLCYLIILPYKALLRRLFE